jgi:glycosyltransferase involved in cell wall biosynthesis
MGARDRDRGVEVRKADDAAPSVTIIVSPRERFGFARESLASIIANTPEPYELIYVDVGMPRRVRDEIEPVVVARGSRLIRTPHYVSPNRARNLALARVRTRYVAFVENDVMVAPGWLDALVACAEETGAAVVAPLMCQGLPLHTVVHCAGGRCAIDIVDVGRGPERRFVERVHFQGRRVDWLARSLERGMTELAEFHCMLVRSDAFARIGALDEKLLGTRDHVDFCLQVREAGMSIWLEPTARASFADDVPLRLGDLPYYMVRWSDAWERASCAHWRQKSRVDIDDSLDHRLRNIGWRRRAYLVRPLAALLWPWRHPTPRRALSRALSVLERAVNAAVSVLHRLRAAG